MNQKYAFFVLLLFSLAISCFFIFKKSERPNILILPYEYYAEKEGSLLDLQNFKYLLNSNVCEKNTTFVQIVTSFAGNVEARSSIRRAYPSEELESLGISRVFLLAALPSGHQVSQTALTNENQRYHDLVQGNFQESYRNLTYKHVMGLKWILENCKQVEYIIKSDDDILIDLYKLIDYVDKSPSFEMLGYVLKNMKPIRLEANKWYVTKEEYAKDSYPPFLSGWLYVTKPLVVKKLLSHTQYFKYFWIDDLFVTGMLAENANVSQRDIRELFSLHPEVVECCLRKGMDCGFLAAPSGGDNALQLKFQIHAKTCYITPCPKLGPGLKIEDKCVAERKNPKFRKGSPSIIIIQ